MQRSDNFVTTLSDVTTKIQPKCDVVTTSCASWVRNNKSLKLAEYKILIYQITGVLDRVWNLHRHF